MPAAGFWAGRMAELAPQLPARPDLVLAVPLGAARRRQRGFNQSAEIGKRLARRLGCAYAARALWRVRETAPQSGLTAEERERNVARAFAAGARVRGRRVLLVDDVLTTGATARAAAAALQRAGASQVMVMTAARAVRAVHIEAAA